MKWIHLPLAVAVVAMCNTAQADLFGLFRSSTPAYYDGMIIQEGEALPAAPNNGPAVELGNVYEKGYMEGGCGCGRGKMWGGHCGMKRGFSCKRSKCGGCAKSWKPKMKFSWGRGCGCEPKVAKGCGCEPKIAKGCGCEPKAPKCRAPKAPKCGCGRGGFKMRRHRGCGCGKVVKGCGCGFDDWKGSTTIETMEGENEVMPPPAPMPEVEAASDRQAGRWLPRFGLSL